MGEHGFTERELAPSLLARIGMGNYLQKQTIPVITTQNEQRIIPIPMDNYNSKIYKFDVRIDGFNYEDYNYTIDEENKKIVLKDNISGIPINKKIDFIFQWNAYISKSIKSPTVYLSDCETKVCTISHNMKKYPHIQVLEVLYGAGIGGAGMYPAGSASKMIYPRIDYVNTNTCNLYLNDEYANYSNPKLNRIAEGKYVVTFDAPCIKSLLILVDKYELFNSDEHCYIDSVSKSITNPVKGFVSNQIIYGNTLVNRWNINNIVSTWDSTNNKAIIEDKTQNIYKASIYTAINVSDKPISLSVYNTATSTYGAEIIIPAKDYKLITLGNNDIIGMVTGKTADGWTAINYSELNSSIIILEGDYTSLNKPSKYFYGIQSVGDFNICNIKAVNTLNDVSPDFKEIDNKYDLPLRGIGAIKDEFDVDSNIKVIKIGNVVLGFDFIDSIKYDISKTNTYKITCGRSYDLGATDLQIASVSDKLKTVNSSDVTSNDIEGIYSISYTATNKAIEVTLNIAKSKLTNLSNTGIISYIKNLNINILYELKNNLEEKYTYLPIKIDSDTAYIVIDSNVLPEVEFS